jgi:hypothetical protein
MNSSQHENDRYNIVMADAALTPKWRERFEFFKKYGAPNSPEARAAFKSLAKLPGRKENLIRISRSGFFFGPLNFLTLGMWRRALTLVSIGISATFLAGVIKDFSPESLALVILALSLSFASPAFFMIVFLVIPPMFEIEHTVAEAVNSGFQICLSSSIVCGVLSAMTANYSYYLKQVKDDNGWNPFKGILRGFTAASSVLVFWFLMVVATLRP